MARRDRLASQPPAGGMLVRAGCTPSTIPRANTLSISRAWVLSRLRCTGRANTHRLAELSCSGAQPLYLCRTRQRQGLGGPLLALAQQEPVYCLLPWHALRCSLL